MSDGHAQTSGSGRSVEVGGAFELVDHHGRLVSDRSYRGQFLLLVFGFTHCRVVCPAALSRLSRVIERLGPRASFLRPLFVTVDPQRDTPEVMKAFLEGNFPYFTGLCGARDRIEHVKSLYRVFATQTADPTDPAGYQVPHTALTYLVGPEGNYIAHFAHGTEEDDLVERIGGYIRAASEISGSDYRSFRSA